MSESATASRTLSAVPTGTVDLVITTLYSVMCSPMRARHCEHVAQVRRPVLIGRRADGDQLELAVIYALLGIRRKAQSPGGEIAFDDGIEARLMDGYFARLSISILRSSTSTQTTWLPASARQAPVTRPT